MSVIPEDVRKRLERQYHPTVSLHDPDSTFQQEVSDQSGQQGTNDSFDTIVSSDSDIEAHLPNETVTEENITQQYVAFTLYCNPFIPAGTSTKDLRERFQDSPKSDGRCFKTWDIFKLIEKLEDKEIKTWAQLALDLGVEPPDFSKGQSGQKVQQYTVRLKRWLHAMHVDAFFGYLLKKPHPYYLQIPSVDLSQPPDTRDGVAVEEDLALRALLPALRPKRGRRKAEDTDDISQTKSPAQRPRLNSPLPAEDFQLAQSAVTPVPQSALRHTFTERNMPWSAIDGPQTAFQWPPANGSSSLQPQIAYPQSAITPTVPQTWDINTASTSTPRARRRVHGPQVSSALHMNSAGSKPRGRPPNNRTFTDGPFTTFPAKPPNMTSSLDPISVMSTNAVPHFVTHDITRAETTAKTTPARPGLSLQVPQRQGGEVRLATPPPVLLVNGQQETSISLSNSQSVDPSIPPGRTDNTMGAFTTKALSQISIKKSRMALLRADHDSEIVNVKAVENYLTAEILSAQWLSTSDQAEACTIAEAVQITRHLIKMLKLQAFSEEMFLLNLSSLIGGSLVSTGFTMMKFSEGDETTYKMTRQMRFGSFGKEFNIEIKVPKEQSGSEDENDMTEENWKQKYETLQREFLQQQRQNAMKQSAFADAMLRTQGESGT